MTLAAQNGGLIEWTIDWAWIVRHRGDVWDRLVEHVVLTVIAVTIGFAIALVLSVLAVRFRRTYRPITAATSVMYTIPSIAVFPALVPFTGLSILTAEIGLVAYTLIMLVRNTVAALDAVPADVHEAAVGMGYSRARLLWEIELPLAVPVIVAGVRIATVTTVGLVTITGLIALGGLGHFIFDGLRRWFLTPLMVGTVLSFLLAVAFDGLLLGIERALTPWARRGGAA